MTRLEKLRQYTENFYKKPEAQLLFHGWSHIEFVTDKAAALALELGADAEIISAAALVHDLDHIKEIKDPVGLRNDILQQQGYSPDEISRINDMIRPVDLVHRDRSFGLDAQILSDANILYKCLPTTAIVMTGAYLKDNSKANLRKLATKIVEEQKPLLKNGTFFLTKPYQERYIHLARQNVELWQSVLDTMDDPVVARLMGYRI